MYTITTAQSMHQLNRATNTLSTCIDNYCENGDRYTLSQKTTLVVCHLNLHQIFTRYILLRFDHEWTKGGAKGPLHPLIFLKIILHPNCRQIFPFLAPWLGATSAPQVYISIFVFAIGKKKSQHSPYKPTAGNFTLHLFSKYRKCDNTKKKSLFLSP